MLAGHRKLIMFVLALLVIALVPLGSTNADVMETLIVVAISGNALEHLGGALREKMASGRIERPGSGSGSDPGKA